MHDKLTTNTNTNLVVLRMMSVASSRLQSYSLKKLIGKGSYGEVFLVTIGAGKKKVCKPVCSCNLIIIIIWTPSLSLFVGGPKEIF